MTYRVLGRVLAGVAVAFIAALLAFRSAGDGGAGDAAGSTPSETLRIEVDLSDRELEVVERGRVVQTHPVTVGSAGHPTPTGSYAIDWIVWNPSWNPPDSEWARGRERVGPGPNNPMGRVKMFFRDPAYYVHGTREVWDLGEAASHGCVRLSNADVMKVARVVMEHGGEARSPGWFKRVINSFRDRREVTLTRPVPVEIRN